MHATPWLQKVCDHVKACAIWLAASRFRQPRPGMRNLASSTSCSAGPHSTQLPAMRLLHTTTHQLKSFGKCNRPPYAILSHTWGPEGSELLYEHVRNLRPGALREKVEAPGVAKVVGACDLAKENGFEYVWIDSCCIDKTSSAELSEAINSMFEWYGRSAVCYVYLADVERGEEGRSIVDSRWFQRGWTLQELIAPSAVLFLSSSWELLGSRKELAADITATTRIGTDLLDRHLINDIGDEASRVLAVQSTLRAFSVATRMSWAAHRQTTRDEDAAYCLLGLFGVNMPLLYGEGGKSAFVRLQREIVQRISDDQSILAWDPVAPSIFGRMGFIFGTSPRGFAQVEDLSVFPRPKLSRGMTLTGSGLQLDVLLGRLVGSSFAIGRKPRAGCRDWTTCFFGCDRYVAVLSFSRSDDFLAQPAIILEERSAQGKKIYVKLVDGIVWLRPCKLSGALSMEFSKGSPFKTLDSK